MMTGQTPNIEVKVIICKASPSLIQKKQEHEVWLTIGMNTQSLKTALNKVFTGSLQHLSINGPNKLMIIKVISME